MANWPDLSLSSLSVDSSIELPPLHMRWHDGLSPLPLGGRHRASSVEPSPDLSLRASALHPITNADSTGSRSSVPLPPPPHVRRSLAPRPPHRLSHRSPRLAPLPTAPAVRRRLPDQPPRSPCAGTTLGANPPSRRLVSRTATGRHIGLRPPPPPSSSTLNAILATAPPTTAPTTTVADTSSAPPASAHHRPDDHRRWLGHRFARRRPDQRRGRRTAHRLDRCHPDGRLGTPPPPPPPPRPPSFGPPARLDVVKTGHSDLVKRRLSPR